MGLPADAVTALKSMLYWLPLPVNIDGLSGTGLPSRVNV